MKAVEEVKRPPEFDELLTVKQLAERLHRPMTTVRAWRADGRGPKGFRVSGSVMYRKADVDEWLAAQYAHAIGDEVPKAS